MCHSADIKSLSKYVLSLDLKVPKSLIAQVRRWKPNKNKTCENSLVLKYMSRTKHAGISPSL